MAELKPGQKFPTPTPGFGDRVFYETLYRQRPGSFMAQEWYVCDKVDNGAVVVISDLSYIQSNREVTKANHSIPASP